MTWNYRVIRTRHSDGSFEFHVHEVYYDEDGTPTSWAAKPARPYGETVAELRTDFELMMQALDKPVLEIVDQNGDFGRLRVAS